MKKLLILGCILILLKSFNVLNISWWLVTLPLWIVPGSALAAIIGILILVILADTFGDTTGQELYKCLEKVFSKSL
jgi:hypothetical protein